MNIRWGCILLLSAMAWTQSDPVIRVTTRLVEVNAIVRDKLGPVRGLTKADFTILDRGKLREITSFSVNSASAVHSATEPLPPGLYSNAPEHRGINRATATVVLLDGLNTPIADQMGATKQFSAFLSQLRSTDRVAVYTLGRSLRILNDFTNDPGRLSTALARYQGRNDHSRGALLPDPFTTGDAKTDAVWNDFLDREKENEQDRMVQITVEALEAIAGRIGSIPGRKNLIWVSAAFPFMTGPFTARAKTYSREVARASRALNSANIAMYPVDARGLVGVPNLSADSNTRPYPPGSIVSFIPLGLDTMDAFAQATGGRAFKNSNDIQGAIRTVLDGSEVSYTLTFQPDPTTLDGLYHSIKLKVNRPGLDIRSREGYYASADASTREQERTVTLRGALASPLESSAIRIRARLENGGFTIILNAADLALDLINNRRTTTLEVILSQRATDGREIANTGYTLRPELDEPHFREALDKGLGFTRSAVPVKDAVEVKIVVYDRASGRAGSILIPL